MRDKNNDSFSLSPRSRALHHVSIMNNTQHRPDAEIGKADHYQKFAAFCDSKQKKPRSNNQEQKAHERPSLNGLNSYHAKLY
jgi:hypothetical protein